MGYACEACHGGVHHLVTDTKYMEILKPDRDEPAAPGETGRIVVSSRDDNLTVYRYELGDLGRWVAGDCPCGRKTPRFELLGRFGDVFKFATNYLNVQSVKKALLDGMNYHGPLQVLLERGEPERMTVCVDESLTPAGALDTLTARCPEIAEALRDGLGRVDVSCQAAQAFLVSEHGGKIRPVVDRRRA